MQAFTRLTLYLAWLAALLFAAAGGMLTYEVVARYFFVRPTIWAAELSQLCLVWGTMLGMAWILSARRHIAVNAVTGLMPPRGRQAAELVALVAVFSFSTIVLWQGWAIFDDSFVRGRTTGSLMNLPAWIAELAVPVGFALLLVQSAIETALVVRDGAPEPLAGAVQE